MLDPAEEVTGHGLGQVGFVFVEVLSGPAAVRCLLVGPETGLERPCPCRIVRPCPSVPFIQPVSQRIEILLPSGRRDVEAPASGEIDACGEHVQVAAAAILAVENRGPAAPVRREACPGEALECIEGCGDLVIGRRILRRPRDHRGAVFVPEGEIVGDHGNGIRAAAQDLDAGSRQARGIDGAEHIGNGACRVLLAADELDVHLAAPGDAFEFALDRKEVARDLERVGCGFVGVCPTRDLVEVVSDPGDLTVSFPEEMPVPGRERLHAPHGLAQQPGKGHAGFAGPGFPLLELAVIDAELDEAGLLAFTDFPCHDGPG